MELLDSNKKKWYQTWDGKNIFMIAVLLFIPFVTSVLSTIHVIDFLELANIRKIAITLAATFEAGLLAALAAMQIVRFLKSKWALYSIFIILTSLQLIGNIYYGYNFMSEKLVANPNWIKNFVELFEFIHDPEDIKGWKRIISIATGACLPIISMIFLHLCMEYIMVDPKKIKSEQKEEEKKETLEPLSQEKVETFSDDEEIKKIDEVQVPTLHQEEIKSEETLEKDEQEEVSEVAEVINEEFPEEDIQISEPLLPSEEQKEEQRVTNHLTEEEINEVKQHQQDNIERINDIKSDLKNSEEENIYIKLLTVLYKNGEIKVGDKIPAWKHLLSAIREQGIKASEDEIKSFLVLCNILRITDMVDTNNCTVKKNFDKAKHIISLVDNETF